MDLIGSIQYIDNRPAGRQSGQEKPAQKHPRINAEDENKEHAESLPSEYDLRLGRTLDTTA